MKAVRVNRKMSLMVLKKKVRSACYPQNMNENVAMMLVKYLNPKSKRILIEMQNVIIVFLS